MSHLVNRAVIVLAALLCGAAPARAAESAAGWSSWTFTPPAGTRQWCCFSGPDWDRRTPGCTLEADSRSRIDAGTGPARVYLRHEGGVLRDVQVYAASCPVQSVTSINDLGIRTTEQSLQALLAAPLDHDRLYPALAAHGTPAAAALRQRAEAARGEARDQAWFWYAVIAPPEAESVLQATIRRESGESDPLVFALAQLPVPRSTRALLAVLRDPHHSLAARKQTLFWLGQSEDPEAQRGVAELLD